MSEVIVEFYGVPRQRAGRAELAVCAGTAGDALRAVMKACPGLQDVLQDEKLAPYLRLSLDGQRFVSEMSERLAAGARLLLLSADAGG
jgi:molybdopterin converting factor small subunit